MHYVVGVDDDYILQDFVTEDYELAVEVALEVFAKPDTWKVDIEARNKRGETLWVRTIKERYDENEFDIGGEG